MNQQTVENEIEELKRRISSIEHWLGNIGYPERRLFIDKCCLLRVEEEKK